MQLWGHRGRPSPYSDSFCGPVPALKPVLSDLPLAANLCCTRLGHSVSIPYALYPLPALTYWILLLWFTLCELSVSCHDPNWWVVVKGTFIFQKESWVSEKEVMHLLSHDWFMIMQSLESIHVSPSQYFFIIWPSLHLIFPLNSFPQASSKTS